MVRFLLSGTPWKTHTNHTRTDIPPNVQTSTKWRGREREPHYMAGLNRNISLEQTSRALIFISGGREELSQPQKRGGRKKKEADPRSSSLSLTRGLFNGNLISRLVDDIVSVTSHFL